MVARPRIRTEVLPFSASSGIRFSDLRSAFEHAVLVVGMALPRAINYYDLGVPSWQLACAVKEVSFRLCNVHHVPIQFTDDEVYGAGIYLVSQDDQGHDEEAIIIAARLSEKIAAAMREFLGLS